MLRHVVLLRFRPGVGDEQVAAMERALAALPGAIPQLRRYEFGADLGLAEDRFHFALIADFDDEAAYRAYAQHPLHLEVLRSSIQPLVDERTAVQYEIGALTRR